MAQGVPTATLLHDGEFKTFYSGTAFRQALKEAQPGDVINLSAGTFLTSTITVPVTVRGAGIGAIDSIGDRSKARTNLSGSFEINIPSNDEGYSLSMEGLVCNEPITITEVKNPIFSKMRIYYLNRSNLDAKMDNVTMIHCIVDEAISMSSSATFQIYNSVFPSFNVDGMLSVSNSVIKTKKNKSLYGGSITLNNCILDNSDDPTEIYNSYGLHLYDCLCIGASDNPYSERNSDSERNNRVLPENVSAFVEGSFYKLTEEAAQYLGSDGTQVGIYGGQHPFSVSTSYPQIKKFTVSPESTTDGKLKIELEIDTDE